MKFKSKSSGFTLIELVVVIVILGILAAVAMPKFMGLQRDARISAVQGLAGAIKSGVSMVYDKSMLLGLEKAATGCLWAYSDGIDDDCDASSVRAQNNDDAIYLIYGWPEATSMGLGRTLSEVPQEFISDSEEYTSDWVFAVVPATSAGAAKSILMWPAQAVKVTSDGTAGCGIIYTEATKTTRPRLDIIKVDC